ncbi:uncharacterized protein EI97DRAFT_454896 [Westerdykella ornata]|uniref:Uncharacterized protein n=1 Tax=Westerdykella ornata TaxID=318751 RepID=A0A6A6JUQ9_WESOR|nr:uncharacterized protein EI97DRAFT_454896 [Westerdykella ornata]KAF2279954.1 hypothetical protein EI97DRAFT_454896 [Westerdykella ornata]
MPSFDYEDSDKEGLTPAGKTTSPSKTTKNSRSGPSDSEDFPIVTTRPSEDHTVTTNQPHISPLSTCLMEKLPTPVAAEHALGSGEGGTLDFETPVPAGEELEAHLAAIPVDENEMDEESKGDVEVRVCTHPTLKNSSNNTIYGEYDAVSGSLRSTAACPEVASEENREDGDDDQDGAEEEHDEMSGSQRSTAAPCDVASDENSEDGDYDQDGAEEENDAMSGSQHSTAASSDVASDDNPEDGDYDPDAGKSDSDSASDSDESGSTNSDRSQPGDKSGKTEPEKEDETEYESDWTELGSGVGDTMDEDGNRVIIPGVSTEEQMKGVLADPRFSKNRVSRKTRIDAMLHRIRQDGNAVQNVPEKKLKGIERYEPEEDDEVEWSMKPVADNIALSSWYEGTIWKNMQTGELWHRPKGMPLKEVDKLIKEKNAQGKGFWKECQYKHCRKNEFYDVEEEKEVRNAGKKWKDLKDDSRPVTLSKKRKAD